jgi:hypothetical protein
MTNDFEKLFSGYIQIYKNNILTKTKQTKKYLYIYRPLTINNENDSIKIYESDTFPDYLTLSTTGYMFVKTKNKLPLLPEFDIRQFKTNFQDFNTFFDKNIEANTLIKISPLSYNKKNKLTTHPIVVDEYNYLMNLNSNSKLNINKLKQNWYNDLNKNDITTSLKWFQYIKSHCPISSQLGIVYNYYDEINNNTFKTKPTFEDICIYYDIKSEDEFEIMKDIELEFEDEEEMVTFYETYNHKLLEVKSKCDDKKIKYKILNDISIELKWKDLNSLNLNWKITDFI